MLERPATGVLPGQGETPPPSTPEPVETPPAPTPPAAPETTETPPAPTGEPPPPTETPAELQARIDRLTREKYEARRLAEEAQARASGLERQLNSRAPQPQPSTAYGPPGEPATDAEERAYQRFKNEQTQNQFNQACNTLYARGREEFGEGMDEAVRGLNAVGWGNRPEALAAITQLPDGHRVYRQLASNLDNAARVLNLPPMAMAMELSRMSLNGSATAGGAVSASPPPVSRAPEPLRPIGGGTRAAPKSLDKMTTAEFIRERDARETGSQRIRR